MERRKSFNRRDLLLIASLLGVAAIVWLVTTTVLTPDEEQIVHGEVYFGGHLIMSVPLNVDQTFSVPGHPDVVFEVRDGYIAFIKSNCPDQICVHTGFISSPWFFAACLPNLLLLTVQAADGLHHTGDGDPDTVAR